MELEGTVMQVLPIFKTTTQRGEFTKQEVILEQPDEYQRKVCVAFTGDRAQLASQLQVGEKIRVSFHIESREYNGRWYTEIRGWKFDKSMPQGYAPQPPYPTAAPAPQPSMGYPVYATPSSPAPAPAPTSTPDESGDVPF